MQLCEIVYPEFTSFQPQAGQNFHLANFLKVAPDLNLV